MTIAAVGGGAAAGGASGGAAAAGRAATAPAAGTQAAGGGSATVPPRSGGQAARRPAAGARGKTGARGRAGKAGKSGTPSKPNPVSGVFDKTAAVEQSFDATANELRGLTLTPPKRITASDGAGFLGGLLIYVLALNYLRFGRDGVKGWLAAKFVNRPWMPPDDTGGDGDKKGSASA